MMTLALALLTVDALEPARSLNEIVDYGAAAVLVVSFCLVYRRDVFLLFMFGPLIFLLAFKESHSVPYSVLISSSLALVVVATSEIGYGLVEAQGTPRALDAQNVAKEAKVAVPRFLQFGAVGAWAGILAAAGGHWIVAAIAVAGAGVGVAGAVDTLRAVERDNRKPRL